jgi:hypothetical protein
MLAYILHIVDTDRSIRWAMEEDKVEGEKEPNIVRVENGGVSSAGMTSVNMYCSNRKNKPEVLQ